jgi:hypothetical protein
MSKGEFLTTIIMFAIVVVLFCIGFFLDPNGDKMHSVDCRNVATDPRSCQMTLDIIFGKDMYEVIYYPATDKAIAEIK